MNRDFELFETEKYRCLVYQQKQTEDIYLTSCGVESCLPNYEFNTGGRSGYHLHVIMSGKGTLYVEGKEQSLHFGQMFMTKPGEDTRYRADGKDPWAYCWMTFDGSNAVKYTESAGFKEGINQLECHVEQARFYGYVRELLDLKELTLANDLSRLAFLLNFLSLAIESHYRSQKPMQREYEYSVDAYVEYAAGFIQANFASARVGDVARAVNLHRSYLTSIFKKKLGISPQGYLMQCKMRRAKQILLESDYPVQEVARMVGYENPLTFSKIFKEYYGSSPRDYRKENGKNSPH